MKLHKNDEVSVLAGKDKGRRGKVERVFPEKSRVLVTGINIYKRHTKKRDEKNPGGIIEFPRPLPASRLGLVCPKCKKITRVGYLMTQKEKQRICKKCKQLV